MQVAKWGNSLAVRLPATLVRELKLEAGDEVELVSGNTMPGGSQAFVVQRKQSRQEIADSLREFAGRLPSGFKFNREQANRRG